MSDEERNPAEDTGQDEPGGVEHTHPGGAAAILGVQLLRYSGYQGISLGITNLIHYSSIVAVGAILGTAHLGQYSLLLFLTALITQLIDVLTKPGTIRRVFGVGDDDDVDDDEDETADEASDRPLRTLGIGISLCALLSAIFIASVAIFREPLADLLLGDRDQANMVVWASITAGTMAVFRLSELVIWFENRPSMFVIVDGSRPTLNLVFIVILTAAGAGLEGAVLGSTIGTTLAMIGALFALRGHLKPAWDVREALEILKRSRRRFPIITSLWVVQNADVFVLSRYVTKTELGVYTLASRTGFMVSFLPQGFRIALRPLRQGAAYKAMKKEYGNSVAMGQLLAYFVLVCITSILAMVLLGEAVVNDAEGAFSDAGGLIPLTAVAMIMPALFRTVSGSANFPHKRTVFVLGAMFVALAYIGLSILLIPDGIIPDGLGIYGPPVALLIAFAIPLSYMFLRSQLSDEPIDFPIWSILRAVAVAAAIGVGFALFHPDGRWPQLAAIIGLMGLWFAALYVLRIVPEYHRAPIAHMARSMVRGSAVNFNMGAGLRALRPEARAALRVAVMDHMAPADLERDGEKLVRTLRRAGRRGKVPVAEPTPRDSEIALALFSNEPTPAVQARMRMLITSNDVDTTDMRLLEELVGQLAKAPAGVWDGTGHSGGRRWRPRPRRA